MMTWKRQLPQNATAVAKPQLVQATTFNSQTLPSSNAQAPPSSTTASLASVPTPASTALPSSQLSFGPSGEASQGTGLSLARPLLSSSSISSFLEFTSVQTTALISSPGTLSSITLSILLPEPPLNSNPPTTTQSRLSPTLLPAAPNSSPALLAASSPFQSPTTSSPRSNPPTTTSRLPNPSASASSSSSTSSPSATRLSPPLLGTLIALATIFTILTLGLLWLLYRRRQRRKELSRNAAPALSPPDLPPLKLAPPASWRWTERERAEAALGVGEYRVEVYGRRAEGQEEEGGRRAVVVLSGDGREYNALTREYMQGVEVDSWGKRGVRFGGGRAGGRESERSMSRWSEDDGD